MQCDLGRRIGVLALWISAPSVRPSVWLGSAAPVPQKAYRVTAWPPMTPFTTDSLSE